MQFSILEKTGVGLFLTAFVLLGAHFIGNFLVHAEPLETAAYSVAGVEAAAPAGEKEQEGAGESALVLLASADAAAGEKAFKKCKACHTTENGGKHKVGPNLWDIIGRAKAGAEGYSFSGALKDLGGEWSYADLDAFLADPKGFAKGTKMSFAGLKKADDRAAVIVYLRALSDSPKPLP